MKGHVRKRGTSWAFVADAGAQLAHRCAACKAKTWATWGRPVTKCPSCGAPLDEARSQRRQTWRSGFATRKAAELALRQFLSSVDSGADPFPGRLTVADWAARWMASDRFTSLRSQTTSRYRQVMTDYVVPTIGDMQLTEVRARHVGLVLERVSERGVTARTVAHARAVLSSCMRAALEAELIDANPVAAVRPPKAKRRQLEVPTGAQLIALMTAARGTTWEIPLLLAATTGMRRSEVLALTWANTDLEAGKVRVVASLQRVRDERGTRLDVLDGKTDRARREIVLPAFAAERLRRWRVEQSQRRLMAGPAWQDRGFICDRGDGGPLDPDAFSNGFKRLASTAGLSPATRLHDVRHGVATVLLDRGVHPAITSAVLGHSNVAFTMTTYQHVLDGMTARAASELDAALGG